MKPEDRSTLVAVVTLVIGFLIAGALIVLLTTAAQRANQDLTRDIRRDVTVHAQASARRSCALAKLLDVGVRSQIGHTLPAAKRLVAEACRFRPVP